MAQLQSQQRARGLTLQQLWYLGLGVGAGVGSVNAWVSTSHTPTLPLTLSLPLTRTRTRTRTLTLTLTLHRQIRALGWALVTVPYFEWQPLRALPEPRSAYLQDILATVEPPSGD